jgi:flagellar biosynthetic protein FliP
MRSITLPAVCLAGLLASTLAWADPTDLSLVQANPQADGGTAYSVSLQLLLVMTALTLLPSLLLAATSFTRVIIVLSILRQALGTAQTPPNQVLIGIALIVTALVMRPTFDEINATALTPFRGGQIGGEAAFELGTEVLKKFMLRNTRNAELLAFADLTNSGQFNSLDEVPLTVAAPAFVISELRAGFEIGFMLFVPFLIIDLVVASILMSLGMMMVSPMMVSLPFKLLLFVSVDGWALTIGSLVQSYAH